MSDERLPGVDEYGFIADPEKFLRAIFGEHPTATFEFEDGSEQVIEIPLSSIRAGTTKFHEDGTMVRQDVWMNPVGGWESGTTIKAPGSWRRHRRWWHRLFG
jgi:hypothetical protein